jgi:hypothetical protein
MATTVKVSSDSSVAISGNFAAADVLAGTRYYVVLATAGATKVIGKITAQKFSTRSAFSVTVSVPPGAYTIGAVGDSNNIYVVDATGFVEGAKPSPGGQGSASVNSTLGGIAAAHLAARTRRLFETMIT